ncbi:type II toxin-antitoxin system VapB family antitoxin [bacterium]|nr:type II toxin-antitoxin system VapB family antitoxin [bacterium]MCI0602106.1 type II toxin-antitoxin system VapB family antitoxin [bacterium]
MKTTVEIPDSLLQEARRLAEKEGSSVKVLVEEGLRRIILERKKGKSFRLRKASFRGKGIQGEVTEGSWERIRDLVYEGRGA